MKIRIIEFIKSNTAWHFRMSIIFLPPARFQLFDTRGSLRPYTMPAIRPRKKNTPNSKIVAYTLRIFPPFTLTESFNYKR